jgi:hypothetical protein
LLAAVLVINSGIGVAFIGAVADFTPKQEGVVSANTTTNTTQSGDFLTHVSTYYPSDSSSPEDIGASDTDDKVAYGPSSSANDARLLRGSDWSEHYQTTGNGGYEVAYWDGGNLMYTGVSDDTLRAYNDSGGLEWSYTSSGSVRTMAVDHETGDVFVYFDAGDTVAGVDSNGNEIFTANHPDGLSAMAFNDGFLYTIDDTITKYNATTGNVNASVELGSYTAGYAAAHNGNYLYIQSPNENLTAYHSNLTEAKSTNLTDTSGDTIRTIVDMTDRDSLLVGGGQTVYQVNAETLSTENQQQFSNLITDMEQVENPSYSEDVTIFIGNTSYLARYSTEPATKTYFVSGTVTGPDGGAVEGTTVTDNNGNSTTTASDGSYSLELPARLTRNR